MKGSSSVTQGNSGNPKIKQQGTVRKVDRRRRKRKEEKEEEVDNGEMNG